ncbi:InlB B-repeat-containing protein, partial [Candidatus Saccharibacteria bacterium]|nr:InlB B-repeat-containing protein [Candidatus Saccharibacteria bacterium]
TTYSQALTDNTWGIALTEPTSQEETIFRGLPTAEKDAMVVKVSGSATEANDETTLYYGAYVTPDLEYGHYTGVTINYIAVPNVTDDITINYHGNGYYFDEAGTKEVNTVTYGQSCEIAYVGGNCRKVYTTEQPYTIAKTSNLNDDGTQNGPYSPRYWDEDAGREILSVNQVVTIPGADGIKVDVEYGLSGDDDSDYLYILKGAYDWDGDDEWPDEDGGIRVYDNATGTITSEIDGDTITIILDSWDEPVEGYDYGIYAKVYPIYNTKPENIEVVEKTVCYYAKSKNLDNNGDQLGPYYYDEGDDEWYYQIVTIPGAKKVKVEIKYAITDEAGIDVAEGYWNGPWNYWEEIFTNGNNITGANEYIIEGSTVTIDMAFWDDPVEGYDYGFYAKLYPVYDEETEDTVAERICSFAIKSGEYKLPVDFPDSWYKWYYVVDDDGYLYTDYDDYLFNDEIGVTRFIRQHYDSFIGKTVDIYAYGYYSVAYDANGGFGKMSPQPVFPYTNSERISYNSFIAPANYEFVGWNTSTDGTGTWYYPDDPIYNLAPMEDTITLYAQWEIACNPEATTINNAICMQDFTGLNRSQITSSMIPEAQYTLIDKRDGKTYTVAKLSVGDGNYEVWMTQNLDHDIVTTENFYTYDNTDIGHGSMQNMDARWTASVATHGSNDFTWNVSYYVLESYDPGDLCWNGALGSYTIATGTTTCGNDKHMHIGNYYNWTAAIAMSDSSVYAGNWNWTDVDQSICPAGWRLPTYSGNESYDNLFSQLNLTAGTNGNIQYDPAYFVYGGYWHGLSDSVGSVGFYWSSVVIDGNLANDSWFDRYGSMASQFNDVRSRGGSIRCVAR